MMPPKGYYITPEQRRKHNLYMFFRMTPEDYDEMLDEQGGRCAICGGIEPFTSGGKYLAVDHDHNCCPGKKTCGECIRGLLCGKCNAAIGLLRDDPKIVRSALAYLEGD